ncbi:metallophosphoesterase [Paenibacillus sp. N3/727]|uniref:metallophosphoesterase n=1 Tax=Paenibacillus sp. N3/727 TaxID=2925845 RepID=UPI001F53A55B|nr:metallophosphoesterase [Paenibacillus sp. N3/727]UNK20491.1 metallophosphoesterase [Paenibacillus sp. N3/727]
MIVWLSIAAGAIALGTFGWMSIEAYGYRVWKETVGSDMLPASFQNYRILFMSDIHRRKLSAKRLQTLNLKPDCILLGGDITEKGVPWNRVRHNLEVLSRIAPVYAVLGNHDLKAGRQSIEELLNDTGTSLLKDRTLMLDKNGESIALSGIMQPATRKHPYSSFKGCPKKGQYHIILVHDPIWIQEKTNISANLILSGHTHGGQIILPLLGAVRLEGFYKKYSAGWYNFPSTASSLHSNVRLLISRGFGTSHIPFRLGCPSEFHLITLQKKP